MNNWIPIEPFDFGPDLGKGWRVKVVAHIRDNQTGEVRPRETEECLHKGTDVPSVFNWKEGNYSCDCNRAIFFGGSDIDGDILCSDGKYSVNLENPKNGEIYYREFDGKQSFSSPITQSAIT